MPAPLVLVGLGMAVSALASGADTGLALTAKQHIALSDLDGPGSLVQALRLPGRSHWNQPENYRVAATIALISNLETLLSVEAVDAMDPLGRTMPAHRELGAQGIGNMVSGLPMTAVIVRSSANVQAGGRTRLSSFLRGVLLTASVAFAAFALEWIP
ncbi:SulP family inorganic anion transporter [Salinisphaera sp. T31B1]|uniref:SulP family inorganic anion transporter n=1 Tax=Salinisphaera sp. T31B1 TaxID=727963 RepID=UPI00333E2A5A